MADKQVDVRITATDQTKAGFASALGNARQFGQQMAGGGSGGGLFGSAGGGVLGLGIGMAAITGGLKGAFEGLTAIASAFEGDMKAADQALRKLPFGLGEVYGALSDFFKTISGSKAQMEREQRQRERDAQSARFTEMAAGFQQQAAMLGMNPTERAIAVANSQAAADWKRIEEEQKSKPADQKSYGAALGGVIALRNKRIETAENADLSAYQREEIEALGALNDARASLIADGYQRESLLLAQKHLRERQLYQGQFKDLLLLRQEYERDALDEAEAARQEEAERAYAQQMAEQAQREAAAAASAKTKASAPYSGGLLYLTQLPGSNVTPAERAMTATAENTRGITDLLRQIYEGIATLANGGGGDL